MRGVTVEVIVATHESFTNEGLLVSGVSHLSHVRFLTLTLVAHNYSAKYFCTIYILQSIACFIAVAIGHE